MRDLSIIRNGRRVVRANSENNGVDNNVSRQGGHRTRGETNRIITHILRFPPGARVTLTNRRLYCALFPVLLVLRYVHLSVGLDGRMVNVEQCLDAMGGCDIE
jgi:hypothetical protein